MKAVTPYRRPTTPRATRHARPDNVVVSATRPGSDDLCARVGTPDLRVAPDKMDQFFKWLGMELSRQPSLRYLDLSHQRLDTKRCEALGRLLSDNPQLKGLKVRYCRMNADGMAYILHGIQAHHGFALCFGSSHFKLDKTVGNALATCQATHIDLPAILGGDKDAKRIVKSLKDNPWVRSLNLPGFKLGKDVEPLLMNGQLTHLYLRDVSPVTGYEMTDLLRALACCASLQVLDLSRLTLVGESEMKVLQTIVRQPNLRALSLSGLPRPRPALAATLREFAAKKALIRKLDLSNNSHWSDEEFDLLMQTLESNRQLHELSLSGCGLTDAQGQRLLDVLSQHCFLTAIDLGRNDLDQESVKKIQLILACNGLGVVIDQHRRNVPGDLLPLIVGYALHPQAPGQGETLPALAAFASASPQSSARY